MVAPTIQKQSDNGHTPEKKQTRIPLPGVGTSGLKAYSGFVHEAYNSLLYYPQAASIYARLRSNPTMTMVWRTFQAWGKQIEPAVDLPEKPTDDDKKYQDFILSDFENMEGGFGQYMDIASNRPVMDGFYVWDAQPSIRSKDWRPPPNQTTGEPDDWNSEEDDGLIGLRRLAPRDNNSFLKWEMPFDTVKGMWQTDAKGRQTLVKIDNDHGLHHTIGNPNSPEGIAGLEAVYRLERIQYGLQVIQGIGFEHAAGHAKFEKVESGALSEEDKLQIGEAALNLLSAQEGNYLYVPYGITADIIDTNFQAAGSILEAIKYYDIMMLAVFMMQTIALNTLTNTGALASQVDTSDMAVFTFNSMIDGLASQYDEQIGKRLWRWNKASFPNATKRPKITFSHIERNIALPTISTVISQLNGILPLGEDDYKAIRKKLGFLPENNPNVTDTAETNRTLDQANQQNQDTVNNGDPVPAK